MACTYIYQRNFDVAAKMLADFEPKAGKYRATVTYGRALFALVGVQKGPAEAVALLRNGLAMMKSQNERFDTCVRIGQTFISMQDTKSARAAFKEAGQYAGSDDMRNQVIKGFEKMCDEIDTLPKIELTSPKPKKD